MIILVKYMNLNLLNNKPSKFRIGFINTNSNTQLFFTDIDLKPI